MNRTRPEGDAVAEAAPPLPGSDHADAHKPERSRVWRRSPGTVVGCMILVLLIAVAVFAPLIAPYSPDAHVGPPFAPPSHEFLLGLDDGGYDVLSLLIWGLRVSLLVGFAATVIAVIVGTTVGVTAGYFGGIGDGVLMRVTDFFLVIPTLPLMIVIANIWGASLFHIIVVIGVLSWTTTAIVLRAQARSVRERTYIKRARAVGATHMRIIRLHLLPQLLPLVVANAVLTVAYAIFTEAALSFLGLGDPNHVSLGTMIEHAFLRAAISSGAWWAIVPPGALITVIVVACSLVGRSMEERMNPRLRSAHLSSRTFRVRAAMPESAGTPR
jgi:peptide/nickel transport system permease protein